MRYRVPSDVAWLEGEGVLPSDDSVYAVKLPDGVPVVLSGSARQVWVLAAAGEPVIEIIAEELGPDGADALDGLTDFMTQLVASQLLVPEEE